MQKIPTLFVKNTDNQATNVITPGCEWVETHIAIATRKFDGMPVKIDKHILYRIPRKTDKDPGEWVKCDFKNKEDNIFFEALETLSFAPDGTYELVGPQVNQNAEQMAKNTLIAHGSVRLQNIPRDFEGLKEYLKPEENDIEGIVFHNLQTGEMAKVRKSDFGFSRKKK